MEHDPPGARRARIGHDPRSHRLRHPPLPPRIRGIHQLSQGDANCAPAQGRRKRARRFPADPQNSPSIRPASFSRIASADGRRGRPGMVMISPQITTMKPAPAASRTSRTGTPKPVGRAAQLRVGGEGVLGLGHADRQVAVAGLLPGVQLGADAGVGQDLVGAVDALGDGLDLLEERHVVGIEHVELRGPGVRELRHPGGELGDALRALGPVAADDRLGAVGGDVGADGVDLRLGVAVEVVERHHRRHAEGADVGDVPAEVGAALRHRRHVLGCRARRGRRRRSSSAPAPSPRSPRRRDAARPCGT